MSIPHFLTRPDRDWSGFTSAQISAAVRLRNRYAQRPLADRDFAAVPLLRDDGAAALVKLTIDLVEPHVYRYWLQHASHSISFPSDE